MIFKKNKISKVERSNDKSMLRLLRLKLQCAVSDFNFKVINQEELDKRMLEIAKKIDELERKYL